MKSLGREGIEASSSLSGLLLSAFSRCKFWVLEDIAQACNKEGVKVTVTDSDRVNERSVTNVITMALRKW
jgi:hypothetical protein